MSTHQTRQAVSLINPSGSEDDYQVIIDWEYNSNPKDKEEARYGGEDDGWSLSEISHVDQAVRKIQSLKELAASDPERAEAMAAWLVRQVEMSHKVKHMPNAELLWWAVKSLPCDALDGNLMETIWNEIEDRIYPGYDGEKVQITDRGWSTPHGPITYVTEEVGKSIAIAREEMFNNKCAYLEKANELAKAVGVKQARIVELENAMRECIARCEKIEAALERAKQLDGWTAEGLK